jgi:secondary thiamine-phosphate synthase enzyme
MRIHNDYLTIQSKEKREFRTITTNVKFAVEKSGITEGIVLVAVLHTNAAVFLNEEETGLLQDVDAWLQKIAPAQADYKHGTKFESNASAHFQSLMLSTTAIVAINGGKLELGPWQQVIYAELDGQRPKKILIKVMGE